MQTIVRNIGDFDDLHFRVDLTQYGRTATDISDIHFNVKKDIDNTSFVFQKKQSLAEITFTGDTIVDVFVQWGSNEYSGFVRDIVYEAGLYLEFTGDSAPDLHTQEDFKLTVKQRVI